MIEFRLSFNLENPQWLQFSTNTNISMDIHIGHKDKYIVRTPSTKFLSLITDDALTWKHHIHYLTGKLNAACCAVTTVKSLLSRKALKILYFSYIHSIMTYGVIFWGNSMHSIKVFEIQKKIIRIMGNFRNRDSCRNRFKTMKILPFY
jgi:hypothetical protein